LKPISNLRPTFSHYEFQLFGNYITVQQVTANGVIGKRFAGVPYQRKWRCFELNHFPINPNEPLHGAPDFFITTFQVQALDKVALQYEGSKYGRPTLQINFRR